MAATQIAPFVWSRLTDQTRLFRFVPKNRFLEMIEKGVNVLTHVTHWEDPYEAFLLRAELEAAAETFDGDMEASIYDQYKLVYGQSWTLYSKESELRWRAYCPNRDGVRIETTVGQLATCVASVVCNKSDAATAKSSAAYIGKIDYHPQAKFNEEMTPRNLARYEDSAIEERMRLFFVKREEFSEEEEVRIVVCPHEAMIDKESDVDGSLLKIHVNPTDLINSVYVDPRMGRRDFQQIVCRLRYRYPEMRVRQSQLFNWPRIKIASSPSADEVPDNTGENGYTRFWRQLQRRLDSSNPIVRYFDLSTRRASNKSDWDLGRRGTRHYRLTFNNGEARINVYAYNQQDASSLRLRFNRFHDDMETIEENPLIGEGVRFSIRNVSVRHDDEATWERAIEWFVRFVPQFYQNICDLE